MEPRLNPEILHWAQPRQDWETVKRKIALEKDQEIRAANGEVAGG